ncbi:MAG TPA: hypothetical protein DCQ26_11080 [Marinilabiliales bacterium]|nr:MAG: hypothetical protein A2W96_15745 [Bacteroidetes bacterium GWD2_40_43]OFX92332.1 MAG: hypothetical protein A2W97_10210 [Bacteroidetes bacterium GWE2_40_63]OFY22935.1 MAG: hypothetical protein A2W88_04195 [Bacteroidetes bacterium GWF2_40_13]OFZ29975.1 MAG: hypothetical protein A2437_00775 [Bacteroidetes bacterium RIFOXYC2_FULL_40_12]HAM99140.1 hypothetical protein [Marinilabiliales bacterium]
MKTGQKATIIVSALLITFIGINKQAHSIDSIQLKSTIVIASEPDYPPYCIVDKNGLADGFSVELFKAAAKAVGMEVTIKIGIWNQIKQDLAEGKIDALPLVGRTPDREHLYEFSMVYLRLHGAIFVKKGTKGINSVKDLENKSIAVMRGDNADEYIQRKNLSSNIFRTHTFEEAFRLLESGKVDAVLVQQVVGLELIKSMKIKNVVPLNIQIDDFRQDFCFATQKGNTELIAHLNEGLSVIIANKTYDAIHHKWFGPSSKEPLSIKEVIVHSLNILIPLVAVLSFVLIFVLRRLVKIKTKILEKEVKEHEKTNQMLHQQQLLLEQMERVSKVGGWDYILETKKISWTNGVYQIYGVHPDDYNPSDLEMDIRFYHPDDRKVLKDAFKQVIEKGKSYNLELRLIAKNSTQKWVWTSGQAEFQGKKVVRVYGSILDITEWKKTEEDLIHTQSLMHEMGKVAKIGGWEFDAATGKGTWTEEVALIHELDPKDETNVEIGSNFYVDDSRKKIEEAINEAIELGKPYDLILELVTAKGNHKWVRTIGNPSYVHGKVAQIRGSFQDITELKESEMELLRLKEDLEVKVEKRTLELDAQVKKLEKSQKAMLYMVEDINDMTTELKNEKQKLIALNKELEAFSYSVSHDLRAPLRAIDSFSRILIEEYGHKLDSEGIRLFQIVTDNAKKMGMLIDDLLAFSRLSRKEIILSKIDMYDMAKSVFQELAVTDAHGKIDFRLQGIPETNGDPSMIKQVWINLIGNAIKFTSKKPERIIEIGFHPENSQLIYYVRDNGSGFDMAYANKLFGVFQRLHSEKEFEGTGVGLAIVQRIVARHHGRIWAEGKVNEGATFYFTIAAETKKL